MGTAAPAVSVVIATYNRSQALRHAIQSVLNASFTDWELLVIGDACTDDTAETIAAFADPRIRFDNLPVRCGDQSGPNNRGIELSCGRYIAFLNHDDIHLPGHLAACVAELEASAADLVWTACAQAVPAAKAGASDRPCRFELSGIPPDSVYSAQVFYSASSWVLRASLAATVGPWEDHHRSYASPSQAWLFRAWRCGAALRFLPILGVIVVPAGDWPFSYARKACPEHEWLSRWIRDDPKYRECILEETAMRVAALRMSRVCFPPMRTVARVLLRPVFAALVALGIYPLSPYFAIVQHRRGEQARRHRRKTGSD